MRHPEEAQAIADYLSPPGAPDYILWANIIDVMLKWPQPDPSAPEYDAKHDSRRISSDGLVLVAVHHQFPVTKDVIGVRVTP